VGAVSDAGKVGKAILTRHHWPSRWYALPCNKASSSSSSSSKRPLSSIVVVASQEEDEELVDGEEEDYEDQELESEQSLQAIDTQLDMQQQVCLPPLPAAVVVHPPRARHVHPSRLDHVQQSSNSEPYFDPAEWEPVHATGSTTAATQIAITTSLAIPDPPPVEQAPPQDPALFQSQSSQEALEKALQAWYTAGYAAALYHVRSGVVKP